MMNLHRRHVLNASILSATLLSGCGMISTQNGTVIVNLANAQAEAKSIYAAFGSFVTELADSLPAKTQVESAYADLGKLVTIFANVPNGSSSIAQAAQSVINTAQALVSLLPLPAATTTAISTGLLLISALLTGVSSITVPAANPAPAGIRAVPVIPGPVPIPLA